MCLGHAKQIKVDKVFVCVEVFSMQTVQKAVDIEVAHLQLTWGSKDLLIKVNFRLAKWSQGSQSVNFPLNFALILNETAFKASEIEIISPMDTRYRSVETCWYNEPLSRVFVTSEVHNHLDRFVVNWHKRQTLATYFLKAFPLHLMGSLCIS